MEKWWICPSVKTISYTLLKKFLLKIILNQQSKLFMFMIYFLREFNLLQLLLPMFSKVLMLEVTIFPPLMEKTSISFPLLIKVLLQRNPVQVLHQDLLLMPQCIFHWLLSLPLSTFFAQICSITMNPIMILVKCALNPVILAFKRVQNVQLAFLDTSIKMTLHAGSVS